MHDTVIVVLCQTVPASRLSKSLEVIGTDTDRSDAYNFLLAFHSNHGPI